MNTPAKTGVELIAEERQKQINVHGFTPEHDDKFTGGQLKFLAQYLLFGNDCFLPKDTWSIDYIKSLHFLPFIEQLTIAGALIAAEIDRRIRSDNPLEK